MAIVESTPKICMTKNEELDSYQASHEARKRIKDNGGTIAYIADTVQQCEEARKLLK